MAFDVSSFEIALFVVDAAIWVHWWSRKFLVSLSARELTRMAGIYIWPVPKTSNFALVETQKAIVVVVADGAIDPTLLDWLAVIILLTAASISADSKTAELELAAVGVTQVAICPALCFFPRGIFLCKRSIFLVSPVRGPKLSKQVVITSKWKIEN